MTAATAGSGGVSAGINCTLRLQGFIAFIKCKSTNKQSCSKIICKIEIFSICFINIVKNSFAINLNDDWFITLKAYLVVA